jgi:nucleoside-diphosphate-sugar epimerase
MVAVRFLGTVLALHFILVTYAAADSTSSSSAAGQTSKNELESNYLSSSSTVMITGAASHLGSFLAIALAEMFPNIKLLLLDQLEAHNLIKIDKPSPWLESQFEPTTSQIKQQKQLEETLARFELKRQRITYVMSHVENAHFYKTDYRPLLRQFHSPDRFDVLEKIFQDFNVTHVVHLEDNILNPNVSQAVPRLRNDDRMGYFDGILHQLHSEKKKGKSVPSLVYASTSDIYNPIHIEDGIGKEDWNVTYPSSLNGMEKLIMERLARLFSEVHGISSIGLRFFHVYGPYGPFDVKQKDPISNLIRDYHESLMSDKSNVGFNRSIFDTYTKKRDYVYIDDAVDAILSAMQIQLKYACGNCNPIINVGTGQARTLLSALVSVDHLHANKVMEFANEEESTQTAVVASMTRANHLLGFHPMVSLEEGLERTIRWYSDRMMLPFNLSMRSQKCSHLDKVCRMDHVLFPCASEWADERQCLPSIYDNAKHISLHLTKSCDVVQYKIVPMTNLERISHVASERNNDRCTADARDKYKHCFIAFVREDSILVSRLKSELGIPLEISLQDTMMMELSSSSGISSSSILKHGIWTLIPISVPTNDERDLIVTMNLPQFSPTSFFGSKYAVYASENITALNLCSFIEQFEENSSSYETMLIFSASNKRNHITADDENGSTHQQHVYQSVQVALHDHITFEPCSLITSFIVHHLQSQNAKQLRRELYAEILRWTPDNVQKSITFILYLQRFWSRYLKSDTLVKTEGSIISILTGENEMNSIIRIIPETNLH